jgi:hypothetical protein
MQLEEAPERPSTEAGGSAARIGMGPSFTRGSQVNGPSRRGTVSGSLSMTRAAPRFRLWNVSKCP